MEDQPRLVMYGTAGGQPMCDSMVVGPMQVITYSAQEQAVISGSGYSRRATRRLTTRHTLLESGKQHMFGGIATCYNLYVWVIFVYMR
eukprot:1372195-Pyramimonas_sp.AAC.1